MAVSAGLEWQVIAAIDEAALERRLLASARSGDSYAQADFGRIHQKLGRKGVTLMLLWEEYCETANDFCLSESVARSSYNLPTSKENHGCYRFCTGKNRRGA